jgi:hypothetical protein
MCTTLVHGSRIEQECKVHSEDKRGPDTEIMLYKREEGNFTKEQYCAIQRYIIKCT